MTTKELLIAARRRIANGWVKHEYAVDKDSERVEPQDPEAVSFCMIGAIWAEGGEAELLIPFLPESFPQGFLADFNDDPYTLKDDVLAVYDRAIEEEAG